jgi:hypothetical protein
MLQRDVQSARGGSPGRWACSLAQEAQVASEKKIKTKMKMKNYL